MPEPDVPEFAPVVSTDADLLRQIGIAVLAVPEVIRLEPTLRSRLRQVSHSPVEAIRQLESGGRADGVTISGRADTRNVTVEVAVSFELGSRPAATVATEIKATVADILSDGGRQPGTIRVAVLAVEPER